MQETLLRTKLYIPPQRPGLVPRPRLIERLDQERRLGHKLTLISAPAGFGKTTLIADFGLRIAESNPQSPFDNPQLCWLSLDEGDNDLPRFLTYLVAALQTIEPNVGEKALALLQSPQPALAESVLTALINDITAVTDNLILVLDDYHLLESQEVDEALNFFIDHLPPNTHLVITTREDPQLPLPRLRARGQLTELRAADLRFTPDEAAVFLNQAMGLNLKAGEIAALEERTEGWIAGLQMAALSMQGRADTAAFIQAFTGSHHFVLDYLIAEVLEQQPQSVQAFLLKTSILDRLTGPLCERITGEQGGQQMLEYLQQANLFIIPLDEERRWFRYHHLFADLLRQRMRRQLPDSLAELHGRASLWYEENGLEVEAFHHAAAAHDLERAECLVQGEGMPLYYRGAAATILHWLESLPQTKLDARPSLWVMYAWVLWVAHKSSQVEEKLQAAQAALQDARPGETTNNLLGQIAALRAMLAANEYDPETIITESNRALNYLHPDNLSVRTAVTRTLGYAYHIQGNRASAGRAYSEAIAMSEASANTFINILATTGLGIIQETETQLHQAFESYRRVLKMVGDPPQPVACEAHSGLGRISYEWNDLVAAQQYGELGLELARPIESIDSVAAGELFLARVKLAQGDIAAAAELLAQADQTVRRHNFIFQIPKLAALQVLLLLRQGDLAAANNLAQTHELPLSQARVYLAHHDPTAALAVLEPFRQEMEARNWTDERLKVMVLQALALQANDQEEEALQLIGRALALAEPGNHIRTFIDEGPPMTQILREASARGIMPAYTNKLLHEFSIPHSEFRIPNSQQSDIRHPTSEMMEPLTPRELEVLQLVAQGLSNREISERLFLALSTVKGHNRIIFDKLQVKNRTEAAACARELGLL